MALRVFVSRCRAVVRLGNQFVIPLRVAARSLSWLMTLAKRKHWDEERRHKRLIDQKTAYSILEWMTKLTPEPTFGVNPLIKLAFADQTCASLPATCRCVALQFPMRK